MHGPGWFLHKSHHIKTRNQKEYELNDLYFLLFSSPSIFCIIYGSLFSNYLFISIGIGILIYGFIYALLHDVMVHNRFGLKFNLDINGNRFTGKVDRIDITDDGHLNIIDYKTSSSYKSKLAK